MADMLNRKALLGSLGQGEDADTAVEPFKAEGLAPGEDAPNTSPAPALDPVLASPTGPADAPIAAKPTNNFGSAMGLDEGKFNDPNKHDFKYDTMRVLSRFDPKAGFSPEVINALNSELGGTYGNYSGGGDKLSLSGAKGAKDAADFANQDWIYAHKAGNDATKWNFGGGGAPAAGGAMGGGGIPGLPPELGGDPMAAIQAALAKYQGKSPNIEALLAQLGGGQ